MMHICVMGALQPLSHTIVLMLRLLHRLLLSLALCSSHLLNRPTQPKLARPVFTGCCVCLCAPQRHLLRPLLLLPQ